MLKTFIVFDEITELKEVDLKEGCRSPLFHLFSSFQTRIANFTTNRNVDKMSIQYTELGFELMTFGTGVSSHNH